MSARIVVVTAGLSEPSTSRVLADSLATATVRALGGDAQVEVIELRAHAHALTDAMLTRFAAPELQTAMDAVVGADAVIAVTPIFSASYNALFKAFFDVLDDGALAGMPVLIGATGGTERHSLALEHAVRPLFGYLRALVVPTAVYAASSDFGARAGDPAGLRERIERAATELAGLLTGRRRAAPTDTFAQVVPFEQLLARTTPR